MTLPEIWQIWIMAGVLVLLLAALVREWARPDVVMLAALAATILTGILPVETAFAGFSNSAVITVGALFVVAAGVQKTGGLAFLAPVLFPRNAGITQTLLRFMLPTAFMSAFLNNTPIVAMLVPQVQQWAERTGQSASKLLIPLSYAAILGGMLTLIVLLLTLFMIWLHWL